jgi:hypothetical protein
LCNEYSIAERLTTSVVSFLRQPLGVRKMELQEIFMGSTNAKKHEGSGRLLSLIRCMALLTMLALVSLVPQSVFPQASSQTPAPRTPPAVGTIKSINGTTLVLATDTGAEVKVQLNPGVKFLRVPPDSKDLKEATAIQVNDLQVGDRILVRGKAGDDPSTFVAAAVIAMKKADIDEKKAHDQEEWQKRGIGGLVKEVDPANSTVTIGTMSAAGPKDVTVNISKSTILRRYAPGSVKFDDAKASTFDEIKPGDQLRARGTKSDDGNSFTGVEVVTGSFRNVSGTISAVDAAAGTLTVADLISNKTVTVRVRPDTQLRKLPAPMAQMIAARLKGVAPGGAPPTGAPPQAAGGPGNAAGPGNASPASSGPGGAASGAFSNKNGGGGGGARGDLQQVLSRLPASGLNDFQKGDAVLIVATSSPSDANFSAITIVGGVEPILQASPQGQASSILSPWSLSNGGGGDTGTP